MANDLQIAGVTLPKVVVGACPSTVSVDVINVGPDPASFPSSMTVCLDIRSSPDGPAAAHYSVEIPIESPPILPKAIRTFTFTEVQFPCAPPAYVKATADCRMSVPNNLRTAPTKEIVVSNIVRLPWLWTDILQVGLRDSTGHVNWTPGALCPGATCVVEVSIRNAGCAVAVPSVTTLEVLDGAGQPISLMKQNTPSIFPGLTSLLPLFTTTLPAAAAGNSLTFRACADVKGAVTPQCDLVHACAEVKRSLATATGGPKLTFSATKSIFPGCVVPISWRIQNFCTDIGKVTAQIKFQGTVLYTSISFPVGLQDAPKGEDIDIALPPAVAPNFYKIGTAQLTLEITGTGADPGPYKATTLVTVTAEPISGTWAFTAPAVGTTGAFPWKAPYTVEGRLTNPSACAIMTPTSIVLNEGPSFGPPIGRTPPPPFGDLVPGAFRSDVYSLIQVWPWLAPGVWIPIGPLTVGFTYTVTFAMQDKFGNAYPASTSASAFVAITVPPHKIGFAIVAHLLFAIGLALAITAALVLAGVIILPAAIAVAAAVGALLSAAGVAFTISGSSGLAALDPPVPDFDYKSVVPTRLPEFPAELTAHAALAPWLPVFALLGRISGVTAAMSATEARLIAARIDREASAIRLQSAEYRALRDSLLAASRHIPLAVVEAIDGVRAEPLLRPLTNARVLRKQTAAWSRRGLPAKLRRSWIASGLPAEQLKAIEQALRTPGFVVRPIDMLLNELTQAVAQIASGVQDEAVIVLHPLAAGIQPEGGEERPHGS